MWNPYNCNSDKSFNMTSIKRAKTSSSSSPLLALSALSGQIIGDNSDLLKEILVRLPIKSLLRFKCVSKHWLDSISSLKPYSKSPCALFIDKFSEKVNPEFDFVSLDSSHFSAPFRDLTFVNDSSSIKILQSCNGLLMCSSFRTSVSRRTYYVYNPTTKQYTVLPPLHDAKRVVGVNLAFDPLKSLHYKVICVRKLRRRYQIDVYSFEEGSWVISTTKPFSYYGYTLFEGGVYCNGAVHWLCNWGDSIYFNVEEEQVNEMPELPVIAEDQNKRMALYFGESRGHLHYSEICGTSESRFDVYEMSKDYSEWRVKYSVDLKAVARAFPEMVQRYVRVRPRHLNRTKLVYQILYVGEGEGDENSFLVIHIPSQIIRYDLKDGNLKKLCDFIPDFPIFAGEENASNFLFCKAYGYFESLASA